MASETQLGRYRLLRLIAEGGMGQVFLARQEGPAGFVKDVVVKRLLAHLANDQSFVELFLDEARLAARLSHPHVVQIFELGEADGSYFIAMEYIHGVSLRELMQRLAALGRTLPVPFAVRLCSQLLQGLQHAHQLKGEDGKPLGLVHRDVSPENVLVSFDGMPKVVDFGIAHVLEKRAHRGLRAGKRRYVAPEQLRLGNVDATADLYAVGVVLLELLTGKLPEPLVLDERPLLGAALAALETILRQALAEAPEARFQSASSFADALEGFLAQSGQPVTTTAALSALLFELFPERAADARVGAEAGSLGFGTEALHTQAPAAGGAAEKVSVPPKDAAPKRSRAGAVWAASALLVGAAAVSAFALLGREPPTRVQAATPTAAEPSISAATSVVAATPHPLPPTPAAVEQPSTASTEPAQSEPPRRQKARAKRPVMQKKDAPEAPARTAKVNFRIVPWADVYLAGKHLGTTPLRPVELTSGRHVFTLRNSELGVEQKVELQVPKGGEVDLRADLLDVRAKRNTAK